MPLRRFAAIFALCALALFAKPDEPAYFVPAHRLPGIGLARRDLNGETLALRTSSMIQSQTFVIMREPQALPGARRIFSPALQRYFKDAERKTGFPATTLQAISYLESWGIPQAESPAGPRGIMQISQATARRMGLRVVYSVRRRTIKTKTLVRYKHGKPVYRTVRSKQTYTVLSRDERMDPRKAISAAAAYLAGMERRFGGRDWAIWAYHCGEGCVADFLSLVRGIPELATPQASVAKMFFECSPAWNRDLYEAIHAQMDRDYSPTYWFRIMRAEQLLQMYRDDPAEFRDLAEQYKSVSDPSQRAPDRLALWLKPSDLIYQSDDAILGAGHNLVDAPDDPDFFGYRLAAGLADSYREAFPYTIGTLAYIAFETRELYQARRPQEAPFVPLEVTAMVLPENARTRRPVRGSRMPEHASGQVFDLSLAGLPTGERECLQFVLDDLGWTGYLGFVDEPSEKQTVHIGCSPTSRQFFASVFEDQQAALQIRRLPASPLPAASK